MQKDTFIELLETDYDYSKEASEYIANELDRDTGLDDINIEETQNYYMEFDDLFDIATYYNVEGGIENFDEDMMVHNVEIIELTDSYLVFSPMG